MSDSVAALARAGSVHSNPARRNVRRIPRLPGEGGIERNFFAAYAAGGATGMFGAFAFMVVLLQIGSEAQSAHSRLAGKRS